MTTDNDKLENARKQGQAQFDSIRDMVAAFECDFDRLEELRERVKDEADSLGEFRANEAFDLVLSDEEKEEFRALEDTAGDCENIDQARERIEEDALAVEVRADWHSPGDTEGAKPSQFRILLCTGGPAVQIRGELNEHSEPCRAWLEVQDWFTPWVEFWPQGEDVQETLLTYARVFYFGE